MLSLTALLALQLTHALHLTRAPAIRRRRVTCKGTKLTSDYVESLFDGFAEFPDDAWAERHSPHPLSYTQLSMYLSWRLAPDDAHYNVCFAARDGQRDGERRDALRASGDCVRVKGRRLPHCSRFGRVDL